MTGILVVSWLNVTPAGPRRMLLCLHPGRFMASSSGGNSSLAEDEIAAALSEDFRIGFLFFLGRMKCVLRLNVIGQRGICSYSLAVIVTVREWLRQSGSCKTVVWAPER